MDVGEVTLGSLSIDLKWGLLTGRATPHTPASGQVTSPTLEGHS